MTRAYRMLVLFNVVAIQLIVLAQYLGWRHHHELNPGLFVAAAVVLAGMAVARRFKPDP